MMTDKDQNEYSGKNSTALWMRHIATENYIGCRIMFLQYFHPKNAMVLAEQACEKMLKCLLLLKGVDKKKIRNRKVAHYPYELIKLYDGWKNTCLEKNLDIAKKLGEAFDRLRYPDFDVNKAGYGGSIGVSSKDLKDIDRLFFCIEDIIPIPDEIRAKSLLYSAICEFDRESNQILTKGNYEINKRKQGIENLYNTHFRSKRP